MRFRHSGDLGDLIYFLPLLKSLGGEHDVFLVDRPNTSILTAREGAIAPLIRSQPYISSCRSSEEEVDYDMCNFRIFHGSTTTLVAAQMTFYHSLSGKFPLVEGRDPWLEIESDDSLAGKIVVARSPRYHNDRFQWKKIVDHYGDRIRFIGLEKEYRDFCGEFGEVERLETKDFLEVAKAIQSCDLFIGNQSSPNAVALGLGKRCIQEVCLWQPDCIFPRDNVQYCTKGGCVLPDISGSGELTIPNTETSYDNACTMFVPPGEWQYPNLPSHTHFKVIQSLVERLENVSPDEARNRIIRHNAKRIPEFFSKTTDGEFYYSEKAIENASTLTKPSESSKL
jgi:hypothetical protein